MSFCADLGRHLPSPTKDDPKKPVTANPQQRVERRSVTKPDLIPAYFEKKLKDICPYCHCKKNILWHNYHRDEQHFDACFRYVDDPFRRDRRCFLKCKSKHDHSAHESH